MYRLPKLGFKAEIIFRLGGQQRAAHDHHLGDVISFGLQEDRVHLYTGFHSCGIGLHCLRAPNFAAVCSHIRVVGHILSFEGRNTEPVLAENTA